jgi:hypothetical protein
MTAIASQHAIRRFQQRIAPCSQAQAIDQLTHAAHIARLPTARELRLAKLGFTGPTILICDIEHLCLVCCRQGSELLILTCYRLEIAA